MSDEDGIVAQSSLAVNTPPNEQPAAPAGDPRAKLPESFWWLKAHKLPGEIRKSAAILLRAGRRHDVVARKLGQEPEVIYMLKMEMNRRGGYLPEEKNDADVMLEVDEHEKRMREELRLAGPTLAPFPSLGSDDDHEDLPTAKEDERTDIGRYRKALRQAAPISERVKILAGFLKSDDEKIRMEALKMIDRIDGFEAKAKEIAPPEKPGMLFQLPGKSKVSLVPVRTRLSSDEPVDEPADKVEEGGSDNPEIPG